MFNCERISLNFINLEFLFINKNEGEMKFIFIDQLLIQYTILFYIEKQVKI